MRFFIFKSETRPELRAFGADLAGSQLPSQFKPWRAVCAVAPDQQPPYNLPRDVIETAIKDQGFQLFRLNTAELTSTKRMRMSKVQKSSKENKKPKADKNRVKESSRR